MNGMLIVIPSRLAVGEAFSIKVKLLGPVHEVPCEGGFNTVKPRQGSPFNRNVMRQIQFMDNALPEWSGRLEVEAPGLDGPDALVFDGKAQGVFPGDRRPIKAFSGLKWAAPGFHFVKLTDPESGVEACSNPVYVSEKAPAERLVWGDPHWQTFFSDGIRCPEELYAFARDQAFLDFGAISDHMEAVTDRQWEYFQAVTNDYNEPGRFATLHGQEWTNHDKKVGAPGHRNIYYRGDGGPVLRSNDPECCTLEQLWGKLDQLPDDEAVAIPHHSANTMMGVDWSLGWSAKYEKAVEVHSVWGSSERHADDGNPKPIRNQTLKGEMRGRHIVDALKLGYRFGFVGGGDIHDGRPGDDLHKASYPPRGFSPHPQGFMAAMVPSLTRENVFDAIVQRKTYATTKRRIYLDVDACKQGGGLAVRVSAASEEDLKEVTLVRNGEDTGVLEAGQDPRVVESSLNVADLGPDEFCYVRVLTDKDNMAWSSPFWGDEV